jgi:CRISPR-associated endoribonuclease Cas6/Csy4 subtype I-F
MKHYLEVNTRCKKQRDQLFGRIHGFLRSHNINDIGVIFPDYKPECYGLRLLVVGSKNNLTAMLKNACLEAEQVSAIAKLQKPISAFARCQSLANKSDTRLTKKIARKIVHFQKKGFEIDIDAIKKQICSAAREYASNNTDRIEVTSRGSGSRFSIRIKKVDFEPKCFSSYGLAVVGG